MRKSQAGFTLVEMMIAVTLGLVIVAAIGYMFQTSKLAFNTSQGLARVQDNGRTAQMLMNSIIREAGYIDDVVDNNDPSKIFTSPALAISGGSPSAVASTFDWITTPSYPRTDTASDYGNQPGNDENNRSLDSDYLEVAFVGSADGSLLNCLGSAVTDTNAISINVFYVDKQKNKDTVPSLYCATRTVQIGNVTADAPGTTSDSQPLVAGITGLQITYGYDSAGKGTIDSYVPASLVTDWTLVKSISIRLTAESNDETNPSGGKNANTQTNGAGTQTLNYGHLTRPIITTLQVRNPLVKQSS